jgi:beta-glucosidase
MILVARIVSSSVQAVLPRGWLASVMLLGALAPRAVRGQSAPDSTPWMNLSLTPDTRAASLVRAMTLPEKLEQMVGTPGLVPELPQCYGTRHVNGIPRLHIPTLRITNGPVGVGQSDCRRVPTVDVLMREPGARLRPRATALPSGMAVAASFDTAVARRFGDVIGTESRALALSVLEGPGVNLARVPEAGRNFEYFGEDPYLTGTMAVAEIRAIQSHGVIAMAKHFVANEQETNRFTVDETVDDRALHELYLLPFEMSVKDGRVAAIMCSYNMVNGAYACEDKHHLTDILRTAWGFTGYVQSDFTALRSTAGSLLAGADHDMPGTFVNNGIRSGPYYAAPRLLNALATQQVTEANIDSALVRRYREMFRLGIFDRPVVEAPIDTLLDGATAASIGEQSAVLLKNAHGIVPLDPKTLHSLAIIGRSEYASQALAGCCGGSSDVIPLYTVTPLDGMRHTLASLGSHATTSLTVVADDNANLAAAVTAARSSEVAVVFAGTIADEGRDRTTISLGPPQDSLIEAVAAANPRTIVVLEDNASTLVPWVGRVPAVLEAWFPGEETGDIVARLLLGAATPSGRLPVTFPVREGDLPAHEPQQWPGVDSTGAAVPVERANNAPTRVRYAEGLEIGYRWFDAHQIAPRFPFGFGLSYTSFAIRDVSVAPGRSDATQPIVVQLTVSNTGRRRGADVPQVYLGLPAGLGEPPKRLVGFAKVWLDPGETRRVRIVIDPAAANHPLGHWVSAAQQWEIASGSYDVTVGTSADEIVWHGTINVRR